MVFKQFFLIDEMRMRTVVSSSIYSSPWAGVNLDKSSPPGFSSTHEMVGLDSFEMVC